METQDPAHSAAEAAEIMREIAEAALNVGDALAAARETLEHLRVCCGDPGDCNEDCC